MQEMIDVVDEEGNTKESKPKGEVISKHLLHKTIHAEIINSKGEILVGKRSESKKIYPGMWDSAVAGHITSGEKPEEAAKREMKEEIGVQAELSFIEKVRSNTPEVDEIVFAYFARHDGPFENNEATEMKFIPASEAAFMRITPPFKKIIALLKKNKLV